MEPQEEHNEAEKGKRNMEKLFDLQVFAQGTPRPPADCPPR